MILEKLILKNFLTFKDFEYNFENKPLQVQGLNLTDLGQKANGTGKSGMQTGIEFCITGTNSREVRDIELITYGEKSAEAELYASCDIRKQTLHIKWKINLKGSNKLELETYDGTEWSSVSFSNTSDGKKYISDWFGISKEDLFSYFIINNTRFKSFFKSSNKQKVDLINRFCDASIIDGVEEVDKTKVESAIKKQESSVSEQIGKIDYIQSQIEDLENRDLEKECEEEKQKLNDKIIKFNNDIEKANDKISSIESDIEITKKEKKEASNQLVEIKASKKESFNKVDLAKQVVDNLNADLIVVKKQHKDLRSKYEALILDIEKDGFDLRKELVGVNRKVSEIEEKINKIETFKKKAGVVLAGVTVCPECHHEWLPKGDPKEIRANLKKLEKTQPILESKLEKAIELRKEAENNLEKNAADLNKEYIKAEEGTQDSKNKIKKVELDLESAESSHKVALNTYQGYEAEEVAANEILEESDRFIEARKKKKKLLLSEIEDIKSNILRLVDLRGELEPKDISDSIAKLNVSKEENEKSLEEINKGLIKLRDKLAELNEWSIIAKQFRSFLANKSLETIQYHMNRFLEEMSVDLRVKLEGFKVLANGDQREEITAKIIREFERSYTSFSRGEQGRLLFASILANQFMINKTHPYGGLNFLSIDEIFEGIDSLGLKFLINAAKTLNMPVMIISHVSDEEADADTLTIVKENGVSRIKS